jgi:hypothetical protein
VTRTRAICATVSSHTSPGPAGPAGGRVRDCGAGRRGPPAAAATRPWIHNPEQWPVMVRPGGSGGVEPGVGGKPGRSAARWSSRRGWRVARRAARSRAHPVLGRRRAARLHRERLQRAPGDPQAAVRRLLGVQGRNAEPHAHARAGVRGLRHPGQPDRAGRHYHPDQPFLDRRPGEAATEVRAFRARRHWSRSRTPRTAATPSTSPRLSVSRRDEVSKPSRRSPPTLVSCRRPTATRPSTGSTCGPSTRVHLRHGRAPHQAQSGRFTDRCLTEATW